MGASDGRGHLGAIAIARFPFASSLPFGQAIVCFGFARLGWSFFTARQTVRSTETAAEFCGCPDVIARCGRGWLAVVRRRQRDRSDRLSARFGGKYGQQDGRRDDGGGPDQSSQEAAGGRTSGRPRVRRRGCDLRIGRQMFLCLPQHTLVEARIQLVPRQRAQGAPQRAQFRQHPRVMRIARRELFHLSALLRIQLAVQVGADPLVGKFLGEFVVRLSHRFGVGQCVPTHGVAWPPIAVERKGAYACSCSTCFKRCFRCRRARCNRLRTVPTGRSRISAIFS